MTNHVQSYTSLLLTILLAVGAIKSAWLADDAFITLRTVRNILDGFGPVWNVGERVQAFTHPLWMLMLTGAVALSREYYYTSLLLSIALALVAFYILLRCLAVDWVSAALGGVILILSKAHVDYATSGLENPLAHLLLVWFLVVYLTKKLALRTFFWLALLAALAALTRLDSIVLYAPMLAYAFWQLRADWRRAAGVLIVGFIPLIAWEIFALVYSGFPFPNTMYAKLFAGIPTGEMVQQGLLYLLDSLAFDPLTGTVILVGFILPWLRRDLRLTAVAIAIGLNVIYLVRIGGDFMYGRFLTGALICAVAIIVRQPLANLPRFELATIFLLAIGLGFANPPRSPWLSSATYVFPEIDNKGLSDERGGYHRYYGLLNANRNNRFTSAGQVTGATDPALNVRSAIGHAGFVASPHTVIVDPLALADPLLARLPAIYNPEWRNGHLERTLPDGYLGTLRTGQNQISDVGLKEYYDRLQLITRGDLFDPQRWEEIWRFNLGMNDHLIDSAAYRYPDRQVRPWVDFDRTWPEHLAYVAEHGTTALRGAQFGAQGIEVDLGEVRHDRLIDLQWSAPLFDIIYVNGKTEVGRQTISTSALRLGQDMFTVVDVPADVAQTGYTHILLMPLLAGTNHLSRVALFDDAATGLASLHPADLLRLSYWIYYRGDRTSRVAQLTALRTALAAATVESWMDAPTEYKIALLKTPDAAIQQLVLDRMPEQIPLAPRDGNPVLRYLGNHDNPLPDDAKEAGAHISLYFEVLAPLEEEYTLWFHIVNRATDAQFMLYDWALPNKTSDWSVGSLVEVSAFLALDPGEYDISFGFWTSPDRERLYVDPTNDIYWIDLGAHTVLPFGADGAP